MRFTIKLTSLGLAVMGIGGYLWSTTHPNVPQVRSKYPIIAVLHDFRLRNQEAELITLKNLQGKVTVVNFIFTTCPGICPILTQNMSAVERNTRELGSNVQFISISVDPMTDSPPVLKDYAKKHGLDLSRWNFLTGPLAEIEKVVVEGFKAEMSKRKVATNEGDEVSELIDISHGRHFVLVDRAGRIRAFKGASSDEELGKIQRIVTELVAEKL